MSEARSLTAKVVSARKARLTAKLADGQAGLTAGFHMLRAARMLPAQYLRAQDGLSLIHI
eukprot:9279037-Alexandrium_andersonii.AAC.1